MAAQGSSVRSATSRASGRSSRSGTGARGATLHARARPGSSPSRTTDGSAVGDISRSLLRPLRGPLPGLRCLSSSDRRRSAPVSRRDRPCSDPGQRGCVLGALRAGCSFYAGYPITPSSEIMELMAAVLPERAGVFLETEDELAALAAVIGASWAGAKAMTATSGPGFSLMQEHIGYAAMTETPCVIVDSQRGGPSTGMPTLPSQGDVMQARGARTATAPRSR